MLKLTFYVPTNDKEKVKDALFAVGAGKIGNYDCCSWEVAGTGQFRALSGSNPSIGEQDKVEKVAEMRIEMVCLEKDIEAIIQALKDSHPYETPAYDVIQMLDF